MWERDAFNTFSYEGEQDLLAGQTRAACRFGEGEDGVWAHS